MLILKLYIKVKIFYTFYELNKVQLLSITHFSILNTSTKILNYRLKKNCNFIS